MANICADRAEAICRSYGDCDRVHLTGSDPEKIREVVQSFESMWEWKRVDDGSDPCRAELVRVEIAPLETR
jgi:hypothetical protein